MSQQKGKPRKADAIKRREVIAAIPGNWLDSLLTGPDAVIGAPPFTCRDIERLMQAVLERVNTLKASR